MGEAMIVEEIIASPWEKKLVRGQKTNKKR